jgi:hypothetical protein
MALSEQLGSVVDQIRLENSLGTLHTKMGDDEQSVAHLLHSVELARRYKDREDLAYSLATLADLKLRMGNLDAVVPLLDETEQLAAELSIGALTAGASCLRAQLALARGSVGKALTHAKRAVAWARKLGQERENGRYLRVLTGVQAANQQS